MGPEFTTYGEFMISPIHYRTRDGISLFHFATNYRRLFVWYCVAIYYISTKCIFPCVWNHVLQGIWSETKEITLQIICLYLSQPHPHTFLEALHWN